MTITFGSTERAATDALVRLALAEDLGEPGDRTGTALIDETADGRVVLRNRQAGTVAGLEVVARVFRELDPSVTLETRCHDGQSIDGPSDLAVLAGPLRSLFAGERTALNFLGHLSGIATTTARFVAAVADTEAVILDTRKTLPGWRRLAKYAVRCGGGTNHRLGLFDGVLIKDNHLAAWSQDGTDVTVADAVRQARQSVPENTPVQVEVDSLEQLIDALEGQPDMVLLDNMPPDQLVEAVGLRNQRAAGIVLEASGGITLETVAEVAGTGIDRISLGTLTHSSQNWDVAFDWCD